MAQSESPSAPGSLKALGLATVAHVSASFCIMAFAPLAPFFQPELNISKVELGLIFSLMYLGVVAGSIPGGYLADRLNARLVMSLGNVVMGGFGFLVATATSYPSTLALLLMVGLGYSVLDPVTTKVVVAWFQSERRATAMSIKQMGVTVGGVLAAALLPTVASYLGWRSAVQIAGIVSIVTGVAIAFLYREARDAEVGRQPTNRRGGLRAVLRDRQILVLTAVAFIYGAAQNSVASYLALFLHEAHFLPVVLAGLGLAAAQAAGAIGRIGWGYASDVLFDGERRQTLIWIGVITVGISAVAALLPAGMSLWVLIPIAALLGASALGWNGMMMTLAGESSHRKMVGQSSGVVLAGAFLGSVVWAPVFGYIVDATGSFGYAWGSVALVTLPGVFVLQLAVRERVARSALNQ